MKKLVKILLSFTIIACLVFSSGCNFILDGSEDSDNGNNGGYTEEIIAELGGRDAWTSEPTSTDLSSYGVTFESGASTTAYTDFTQAYIAVKNACVAIRVKSDPNSNSYTSGSGTFIDVDYDGEPSGSGFFAKREYFILTCHHVIDGGGDIYVYMPDDTGKNVGDDGYDSEYCFTGRIDTNIVDDGDQQITLVGGDKSSDVAILKLTLKGTDISKYDNIVEVKVPSTSYQTQVAERVFAIGNPTGGLPGSYSEGSIAYLYRSVNISEIGTMDLYQINVDIYPGSSGGALFNRYGEIIGITSAGNTQHAGINYAIPYSFNTNISDNGFIEIATNLIATNLKYPDNYGFVPGHNVRFGFAVSQVDESVFVASVETDGLAYACDFRAGDQIIQVNSEDITTFKQISDAISKSDIGDVITFKVLRGTATKDLELPLCQYHFCDTGWAPETVSPTP